MHRDSRSRSQRSLDLVQLRSFLAVADQLGFSAGARQLGLSQSAVSQHVRRLEQVMGVPLLARDTHTVNLTAEGESLTGIARSMLDLNDDTFRLFEAAEPRGRVRFGVSEDFALSRLPSLLDRFRRDYPGVDLELVIGLSAELQRRLQARELDVILAKRLSDGDAENIIFQDRMTWISAPGFTLERSGPVPLVMYPPPSLTRAAAIHALDTIGRGYYTVCSSGSLSGLRAAALAGLGVLPFTRSLMPSGLVEYPGTLPQLPVTRFELSTRGQATSAAVRALTRSIRAHPQELQNPTGFSGEQTSR